VAAIFNHDSIWFANETIALGDLKQPEQSSFVGSTLIFAKTRVFEPLGNWNRLRGPSIFLSSQQDYINASTRHGPTVT
jgi:hypothetical protein